MTLKETVKDALNLEEDPVLLPLGGGAGGTSYRCETRHQVLFCKVTARGLTVEARGLKLIADAAPELATPRPIFCSDELIVLPFLERAPRGPDFEETLGRGLASLHKKSAPKFGFDLDGTCGPSPQPNPWTDDWPTFFGEHRLNLQLELGRPPRAVCRAVERVITRLPDLLPGGPPALIHGDLWSGNLMSIAEQTAKVGRPALIDPAPYFAHREAEFGMMVLFGGFSARVYDAYDEAWPLENGWRARAELYSLYHLLNHHTIFGGGYAGQALDVALRFS